GIFEETARWVGYKLLKKKGDSFAAALTLGAGHGGIEAIIIGASVLASLVSMLALQNSSEALSALSPNQAALAQQQMQAYWATPWHMPLAGAVERIAALGLHIGLSVMVWLAISFRKPLWFWLAVLYHAVVDGLAVLAISFGLHPWWIEAGLMLISFGMLYVIIKTARRMDQERVVLLDL
ncbi:MAG: YhfC family intramembrane metalloprotease, partial [Anaerolineaceae bacterium]|nr:YhfC family intramembrane metalloprotease [Anaerolineaceae bacterium]